MLASLITFSAYEAAAAACKKLGKALGAGGIRGDAEPRRARTSRR